MNNTNNEISTLENIIKRMPVYKEYTFKIIKDDKKLKIDSLGSSFFYAMFNTLKCDLLCVECKKEYSFDVVNRICDLTDDCDQEYYKTDDYFIGHINLMEPDFLTFENLYKNSFNSVFDKSGVIEQYLYCNKYPQKHIYVIYYRYRIEKDNISIMKIGQDVPSFMLSENLSNTYKKELKNYNAFDDFRSYEQSISRELKAGACTYLRRVLEKIVITKYIKKNGKNDNKPFEEKIRAVIDEFDEDIRDILKNTYGLLSKGIHELDENEIDNFINNTYEVITIQLDYEKMIREKIERRKLLKSQIDFNSLKYNN